MPGVCLPEGQDDVNKWFVGKDHCVPADLVSFVKNWLFANLENAGALEEEILLFVEISPSGVSS